MCESTFGKCFYVIEVTDYFHGFITSRTSSLKRLEEQKDYAKFDKGFRSQLNKENIKQKRKVLISQNLHK